MRINMRSCILLWVATFFLCAGAHAEPSGSVYLIGNSLTWDTLPPKLDGDVRYHVDCGKSLKFIYENPSAPCVKTSTLWPTALKEKQYDWIVVQPHYGTTLEEDVAVISKWMKMQPKAVFVIHTGWARQISREEEYADDSADGPMTHSPVYFNALVEALRKKHPDRTIRQTYAIELLQRVADDIKAKQAPFAELAELHRDAIHMHGNSGKYLMHNAMRTALQQERSDKGFEKMDAKVKTYLDDVLDTLETE